MQPGWFTEISTAGTCAGVMNRPVTIYIISPFVAKILRACRQEMQTCLVGVIVALKCTEYRGDYPELIDRFARLGIHENVTTTDTPPSEDVDVSHAPRPSDTPDVPIGILSANASIVQPRRSDYGKLSPLLRDILRLLASGAAGGADNHAEWGTLLLLCESRALEIARELIILAERLGVMPVSTGTDWVADLAGFGLPKHCPLMYMMYPSAKIASLLHRLLYLTRVRPELKHAEVLNVKRGAVVQSSHAEFADLSASAVMFRKLNVRFDQEVGMDAGGVTRDWLNEFAVSLMTNAEGDWLRARPDGLMELNVVAAADDDLLFEAIGRFLATSLIFQVPIGIRFPLHYYAALLGESVELHHLSVDEPELCQSLKFVLEADADVLNDLQLEMEWYGETFTATADNRESFVYLKMIALTSSNAFVNFKVGFAGVLPWRSLTNLWTAKELRDAIAGVVEVDVSDWQSAFTYEGYSPQSPQVVWFWEVVDGMEQSQRVGLLRFVAAYHNPPTGGFRQSGLAFIVRRINLDDQHLPSSHTCSNTLDLPPYSGKEILKYKILQAIDADPAMGVI